MAAQDCLHCEARLATTISGLCEPCHRREAVRVLYLRRRGWTPELEARIREYTRRAKARRPLFDPPV